MRFLVLLALAMSLRAQSYDLLLQGGRVIDPKNGLDAVRDVAIKDKRIAAVAAKLDPAQARKVINVAGLVVTPGLVDIHVHVYAGTGAKGSYAGDNSLYPDGFTFRVGVTTIVDAGSSGWRNFPDFKDRIIDRAKTRVLALLNIVGNGMGGKVEQNLDDMDAASTAKMAKQYPAVVVGIKTAHYSGPEWTPVERGVEAGKLAGVPLMVDFGTFHPARPYQQLVLEKLRAGDISTHCFLDAVPVVDEQGKLLPYLKQARERGVIFDVGHGGGSFLWRQAMPAMKQGFWPDSISTDLHVGSMNAGLKDMLNVMAKFLNMGMPLPEVIRRSTWNPAREIQRPELGQLSVGAPADVAVLRVETGRFGFVDSYGAKLTGTQNLAAELTVRDGLVVWDLNGISRPDWTELGPRYKAQGENVWDGTLNPVVRGRK